MKGSVLGILLAATLSLQAGQIYKWTDAQGRVHYGDRSTAADAEKVEIRQTPARQQNPAASEAERSRRRQRMLDIYREERAEKQAARKKHEQERAERKEGCRRARLEYDRYNNSRAIYDYRPDGERRYLSEQERDQYIAGLRRRIEQLCD